jgi:hypothetical protein
MKIRFDLRNPILAVTFMAAFSALLAYGQPGQGRGTGTPAYDPKTETTITGVVQEVKEVSGPVRDTGTHLIVKAGNEVENIHVGPTWYLKQQKYAFAKNDQIEVIGSRVKYQGADVIIARRVKKGDNTWTLRDAQGIPVWSRGGNR